MERQLQERMIGATVLMVVAVLVVPELLSGPRPAATPPSGVESTPALMASLQSPRDTLPPRVAAPTAPPPRPASAEPPVLRSLSPPAVTPPTASPPALVLPKERAPQTPTPLAKPVTPAAKPVVASPLPREQPPKVPAKPASEKRTAGKGSWSVQVGSYAKPAAAQRVAKDLQQQGFDAVILPVELQGKRLYRVRVGPATDRKTADQTLRRVQRLMPSSRLVGNP